MSFRIRHAISQQLINLLNISNKNIKLSSKFEINRRINGSHIIPELHLPVAHLKDSIGDDGGCWLTDFAAIKSLKIADPKQYPDECHLNAIDFIHNKKNNTISKIIFQLKLNGFLCDSIENGLEPVIIDRINTPNNGSSNPTLKNVLVEFSSPNIAKPFHVGHLRSTIIGNFISNLYHFVRMPNSMEDQQQQQQKYNVIRMNYLGDWGTQFGYLQIGLNEIGDGEMKLNPIKHLFTAYVHANRLAATNEEIPKMAKKIFYDLEMNNGDNTNLDQWNVYRKYTINELTKIYQRLGITFDEYLWESQYNRQSIEWCLDLMKRKGIMEKTNDGEQWIIKKIDDDDDDDEGREKLITIIKNDGTTLYLTRDIASLIERYHKYQFHKLYYIVDSSQHEHFKTLFAIIKRLIPADDDDHRIAERIDHIKFGRIKGMSTRKGNVIFLNDILDEAKLIMKQKQIESPTTKVNITNMEDDTADVLGISAVIINDLKQRRTKDYDFDWDKALQTNGDTGIKLQYTHCRLCSLEETVINNSSDSSIQMPIECKPELLMEFEAQNLIYEIGKFQEIIGKTEEHLEACILVNYLFSLCNAISKALKQLNIKNHENIEVKQQRILLFHSARKVLHQGMLILGLKPLDKM